MLYLPDINQREGVETPKNKQAKLRHIESSIGQNLKEIQQEEEIIFLDEFTFNKLLVVPEISSVGY